MKTGMDQITPTCLVFDTCSLLEPPGVVEFILSLKSTQVVIPSTVVKELQGLQLDYHVGVRAKRVLTVIEDSTKKDSKWNYIVKQKSHEKDSRIEEFARCSDTRILSCAVFMNRDVYNSNNNNKGSKAVKRLVLVTEDVYMKIRAAAYDVEAMDVNSMKRFF